MRIGRNVVLALAALSMTTGCQALRRQPVEEAPPPHTAAEEEASPPSAEEIVEERDKREVGKLVIAALLRFESINLAEIDDLREEIEAHREEIAQKRKLLAQWESLPEQDDPDRELQRQRALDRGPQLIEELQAEIEGLERAISGLEARNEQVRSFLRGPEASEEEPDMLPPPPPPEEEAVEETEESDPLPPGF